MPKSSKLLETIRCLDGNVLHLNYHQKRMNLSCRILGYTDNISLHLNPPKLGLYRCRVVYEKEIEKIEYIPYIKKNISSFKLIHSDISYSLKYENRDEINNLYKQRGDSDEIIIVKNGLITDTSIANICFFNGKEWLTPKNPLLNGTTRQRLLDENKIKTADISYKEIKKYSKIALLNAMIDFDIKENAIIS